MKKSMFLTSDIKFKCVNVLAFDLILVIQVFFFLPEWYSNMPSLSSCKCLFDYSQHFLQSEQNASSRLLWLSFYLIWTILLLSLCGFTFTLSQTGIVLKRQCVPGAKGDPIPVWTCCVLLVLPCKVMASSITSLWEVESHMVLGVEMAG